jgi:hypothetical protein
MYIAEQVLVPGWTTPGEVTFQTYHSAYTATGDIVNTLNWEASLHGSNWQGYFFGQVPAANLTQAILNNAIMSDLYYSNSPVIAITNTGYLPSWNKSGIIHAIAIIGYNNTNQTYTYVDTCGGPSGCGSLGQGVYSISQSALYNAIQNANGNGAIVW